MNDDDDDDEIEKGPFRGWDSGSVAAFMLPALAIVLYGTVAFFMRCCI